MLVITDLVVLACSFLALTVTTLWANSADDKMIIYFPENRLDVVEVLLNKDSGQIPANKGFY